MSDQATEKGGDKPHLVSSDKSGREPVIRAAEIHGYEKMGLPEFVAPDHVVAAVHAPTPANQAAEARASAQAPTSTASPSGSAPAPAEPIQAPVVPVLDEVELAKLREEGYQVGYRRGHEEGVEAGHKVGYQQGRQDGQKAGHQVGEEAGMAEGLQKGEQQARDAMEQEIRETLATLQGAIGKLVEPTANQESAVVHEVVGLVVTIVEHVLQRELHYDSTQITQVVRGALGSLPPSAEGVRIHLNQRDVERIENLRREMGEGWQVVMDASMEAGGCRIETEDTIVDASTEQRLRQCVDQLTAEFLHDEPQVTADEAVTLEGDVPDEPSEPDPEDSPTT